MRGQEGEKLILYIRESFSDPEPKNGVTAERGPEKVEHGRRKLSVVTNRMPKKGRRYLTFIYTERALIAIFNLSDYIN